MEVVQILNDGNLSQNQWGEFVSLDGTSHQVFQDVVTLAPEPSPQYYIVDADGSLLPILDGENIAFLAAESDNEVPSWRLDHMYARKPREPGMEQVKPTKRRSKKKELLTSQFFVPEMVEDTPPKINIIRQRHAPTYSRPKILTSPQKYSNPCASTNSSLYNYSYSSSTASTTSSSSIYSGFNISKAKVENESRINEDCSVPSPGAVVTVCDGMELDPIIVSSSKPVKSSRKFMYNVSSSLLPAQLEIRNLSLDSIGEPEDESELFFDFPMEEEEEGTTIDVDFNEISMNSGVGSTSSKEKEILGSITPPITFFHQSSNHSTEIETDHLDNFVMRENNSMTPLLSPWDSDSSSVPIVNHHHDHQKNSFHSTNTLEVRKRGRPRKNQSIYSIDSLKSPKAISKVKEKQDVLQSVTPTRRSTRPVKVPSRLTD